MTRVLPRLIPCLVVFFFVSLSAYAQSPEIPFRFEENRGQEATSARYIGWADGYVAEMYPNEVVFRGMGQPVHMTFEGAEKNFELRAADPMKATTDVYNPRDGRFYKALPNYERVLYPKVYPGVDVIFRGNDRKLEFDFAIAPDADYQSIRLDFSGQTDLSVTNDGVLVLTTNEGEMQLPPPVVYQEFENSRNTINARYVKDGSHAIRFEVNAYDAAKPLIIDPQIIFAGYQGGSGKLVSAVATAMGPAGAVALFNIYRRDDLYSNEIFIVSYNANGTSGFYRSGADANWYGSGSAYAIAVDNQNNIAVLGSMATWGPNPPWAPSATAFQTRPAAITLIKFGTNAFASYLGGTGSDIATALAFDPEGNIYVAGTTASTDFPTRNAFQNHLAGGYDAFLTKVDPAGTQILYSTYLGGSGDERANDIRADAFGNAYLAGWTRSSDFPTANALQSTWGGGTCSTTSDGVTQSFPCSDMFVTKLNPAGTALVYSTYLGGSSEDSAYAIRVTPEGDAFISAGAGFDFPLTSTVFTLGSVLLRLDRSGSRMVYSLRFPSGPIAVDSTGNLTVLSSVSPESSSAFPILNAFTAEPTSGETVSKFDPTGSLIFSTPIPGRTGGRGIEVDADGNTYFFSVERCSDGYSSSYPSTNGSAPPICNVVTDFVPLLFVMAPNSGSDTSARYSRIEENYPMVKFSGTWLSNAPAQTQHSMGRAVLAIDPGASFTLNFTGSEIHWFGCKDEWAGIAKVTLDDASLGEVDTYMTPGRCGVEIWSKSGLGAGPHTLKVEVAGKRNPSSSSNWIWLDKLELTSSGDASFDAGFAGVGNTGGENTDGGLTGGNTTRSFTRVEQTMSAVAYYGSWYTINGTSLSGGSAIEGLNAGDRVTFTFNGTAARWIGHKDPWAGIANVYVDGALQTQVDTYSATNVPQAVLYTTPTLSSGTHTLTIEATYTRNEAASSRWIWVDAFEWTAGEPGSTGSSGGGSTGGNTCRPNSSARTGSPGGTIGATFSWQQ